MKKALQSKLQSDSSLFRLAREADPRRGRKWIEQACRFYDRFKPPCTFTTVEMDRLFEEFDPDYAAGAQTPQGRGAWVRRVCSAARTPAMNTDGRAAFDIYHVARGQWRCELVVDAMMLGLPLTKAQSYIETLATEERYYEEALPIEQLSRMEVKRLEQHASYTKQLIETFQMQVDVAVRAHRSLMHSMIEDGKQSSLPSLDEEHKDDEAQ